MSRLGNNFAFKVISLLASIMLYFIVKEERNPPVSRQMLVPIRREHAPPDAFIDSDTQQVEVVANGPKSEIDRLKETDISATANIGLSSVTAP
ncbi:MAG TPA: hypothetical protein VGS41_03335, partial [Chthonomonadales bacterium]|nr:hypothetical protein [Chthonomonadales bacterium]